MISIYDDLLEDNEIIHIENFLRDPKFPWYLSSKDNHYTTGQQHREQYANADSHEAVLLTHDFYIDGTRNSENYLLSDFILDRFLSRSNFNFKSLLRSKANLQMISNPTDKLYTTPHTDQNIDHYVLIYYANNSDGDTYIFSDHTKGIILEQVAPKKGRFLLFEGKLFHAAGLCRNSDFRININYNIL